MIKRGSHAFRRQFDLAGIIRLGGEKSKGEWNQELSYFRLTSADPNIDDAKKLVKVYGEKPTALHIMLPSDDVGEVFDDAYELWKGSKKENVRGVLLCRGDGIEAERIVSEDDPWDREIVKCPCPENCAYALERTPKKLRDEGKSACGACGRLREICYRVSVLEVFEIRTGSINAFQGIRNKLLEIARNPFVGGEGRLMGIPLILRRVPKKNRFGKVNYPCRIEVPTWDEWQQEIAFIRKVAEAISAPMREVREIAEGPRNPPSRVLPMPPEPEAMPEDLVPRSMKEGRVPEPETIVPPFEEDGPTGEGILPDEPPPPPRKPDPPPKKPGTPGLLDDIFDSLGAGFEP